MKQTYRRCVEANRRRWDEISNRRISTDEYGRRALKRGGLTVHPLEIGEVGPLRGRSLLHLQCNTGMDTLSWARLGAHVIGVDYSHGAIMAARQLAEEMGVKARFMETNLYDLAKRLSDRFDVIYTAKGVLCWLPDIAGWARVVSHFLKRGGIFYLLDDHPISAIFEMEPGKRGRSGPTRPYFYDRPHAYTDTKGKLRSRTSFEWNHPISDVLGSLLEAGLSVECLREFPYSHWQTFPSMCFRRDGWWHLPRGEGILPLMWSVRARKT